MVRTVLFKICRSIVCLCVFVYIVSPHVYADERSAPTLHYPAFALCSGYPQLPPLSAKAVLLVDALNLQVIAQRGEKNIRSVASITKLMTALVTLEALARGEFSLEKRYRVLRDAVVSLPFDASRVGFVMGDMPTGLELLKGLFIRSGNDAALVLAHYVGGAVSDFVATMNARALELGLTNTVFADPTGLSPNNKSTASEVARLALYLLNYKDFDIISITKNPSMMWKGVSYRGTNFHLLVDKSGIVDGLKTGYIEEAQFNLVATAMHKKRRLLAVVLGVPGNTVQEGVKKRNEETRQILDYGYGAFSLVALRYKTPLRVWGGKVDTLSAHSREKLYAVPARWASQISSSHALHADLWAPVQKEVLVGEVRYEYRNAENSCPIAELDLVSSEKVEPKIIQLFDKLRYFFHKQGEQKAARD